jgi:hypothetical protein
LNQIIEHCALALPSSAKEENRAFLDKFPGIFAAIEQEPWKFFFDFHVPEFFFDVIPLQGLFQASVVLSTNRRSFADATLPLCGHALFYATNTHC